VKLRRYLLCRCVAACRSDIYVYFNVNFNVFLKQKSAFVGE